MLAHFSALDASKSPKELFAADIQKDLLLLEEQEGSVNFKFGVVYMKAGQKCDDEMLSNGNIWATKTTTTLRKAERRNSWLYNAIHQHCGRSAHAFYLFSLHTNTTINTEHGSEEFEEFLQLLGQRITLRGWERFRGGLDVKGMFTHVLRNAWCCGLRRHVYRLRTNNCVSNHSTTCRRHDGQNIRLHAVRRPRNHVSRVHAATLLAG